MEITKIVLTGGPAAGKTTILIDLMKHLRSKGKNVVCVSETARELISAGLEPIGDFDHIMCFQDLVLKMQVSKEKNIEEFVKNVYSNDTVIIYDRGVLDNKAYLESQEAFDILMNNNKLNEISIANKYDLIIDLVSSAKLGEDYYVNDNERIEKINYAVKIDYDTTKAWLLSDNVEVINPTVNPDEKKKKLLGIVDKYLDREYELISNEKEIDIDKTDFSLYDDNNSKTIFKTDYYLDIDTKYTNYIISKKDYKNNSSYVFTIIENINGLKKLVKRNVISESEFKKIVKYCKIKKIVDSTEIKFMGEDQNIFTINISNEGAYIKCNNDDYKMPDNIKLKGGVKKLTFNNK